MAESAAQAAGQEAGGERPGSEDRAPSPGASAEGTTGGARPAGEAEEEIEGQGASSTPIEARVPEEDALEGIDPALLRRGFWPTREEWREVALELPRVALRTLFWPDRALCDAHRAGRGARIRGLAWIALAAAFLPLVQTLLLPGGAFSWGRWPLRVAGIAGSGLVASLLSHLLRRRKEMGEARFSDDLFLAGGSLLPLLMLGVVGAFIHAFSAPGLLQRFGMMLPSFAILLGAFVYSSGLRALTDATERAAVRAALTISFALLLLTVVILGV